MRLAELVSQFPGARLAAPEDNAQILEFFERAPMQARAFDVQYRRRPDFFRLLRYQSDRAFVIVSEDDRGRVRSVGTVSLRPGWVDGQPTTVGYLGDLRISLDRVVSSKWRTLFAALVTRAPEVEELADCTGWFTAVIDDNRPALAALTRASSAAARRARPSQPTLVPIGPFTMRNLIMRVPLARRAGAGGAWQLRQAQAPDLATLSAFFEQENRGLPFGFRGELTRRLSRWDGLSILDFVYAADDRGVLACMAPWSPGTAKQTVVSRVPAALRWFGRAARLLPSPPLRVPDSGEPLRMLYLTHLTFAARLAPGTRQAVFRSMLDHLFDRWRGADWHAVALCDFQAWDLGHALRAFVQQTVPITVYEVVPPGHVHTETALRPSGPPAFEMAMV